MCSHFLGQAKKEHDYNKFPYLKHIENIIERINKKTSVLVVKFNDMFAKVEDFYMEYVKKFVYNKKLVAIFYAGIVLLTLILCVYLILMGFFNSYSLIT